MKYPIYDDNSGRCKVCHAETLWGDVSHEKECEFLKMMQERDEYKRELERVANAFADFAGCVMDEDISRR